MTLWPASSWPFDPGRRGEFRVFNQFTESSRSSGIGRHGVRRRAGGATIVHLDDPRVELEEHYYRAAHTKLLDLGLMPFLLGDELLADLLAIARTHVDRIELSALAPKVMWRTYIERALTHRPGEDRKAKPVRASPDATTSTRWRG